MAFLSSQRFRGAVGIVPVLLASSPAWARPRAVVEASPPVVLVIRSGATDETRRRELKLVDQLVLALDGFMLLSQQADRSDFARLPLADQIAEVLPDAKKNEAMAVVWMSFPLQNQVMLHLIALGSGRALIRTIETDRSPVSERTLALMARELLGTAYLFEPPSTVPAEVTQVVQSVKQQIAPVPPPPPAVEATPPSPWSAFARVRSSFPLDGGLDAVPVVNAALFAEHRAPFVSRASLGVTGSYASIGRSDTAGAQFFSLGAAAGLYRGFDFGRASVGPMLEASLSRGFFIAPTSAGAWLPALQLGGRIRSEGTPLLGFELAVAWSPNQATLSLAHVPLFRTSSVELVLAFSVGWQGI